MINDLNTLLFCPVCNRRYAKNASRTVATKGSSVIMHMTCSSCKSASLTMVSGGKGSEGVVTMGMLTDLSYDETLERIKDGPISADEVLELREKIN